MGDILEDLTERKFGRLTVIERAEDYVEPKSKKRHPQWLCLCTCGNRKIILGNNLKRGLTNSCGCIKKEVASIIHKKKNNYENIGNGITKVFFNNNNGYFLCDTSEWDKVKDITWIKSGNGYVYGVIKNQYVKFHRYIMDINDKEHEVDHIDGNPLNNLKTNLRICYKEENSMNQKISTKNTSGHVGVYWDASRNKWCARINANKKTILKEDLMEVANNTCKSNPNCNNCNECMKGSPYRFCCKDECGEHEFCRGCAYKDSRK